MPLLFKQLRVAERRGRVEKLSGRISNSFPSFATQTRANARNNKPRRNTLHIFDSTLTPPGTEGIRHYIHVIIFVFLLLPFPQEDALLRQCTQHFSGSLWLLQQYRAPPQSQHPVHVLMRFTVRCTHHAFTQAALLPRHTPY